MNLVFGSPGRYVQGTEVLAQAGTYLAHCGRTAVVVIDSYVLGLIRERLDATCALANVALHRKVPLADVAHTALFLASPVGRSFTGQSLNVCAGIQSLR